MVAEGKQRTWEWDEDDSTYISDKAPRKAENNVFHMVEGSLEVKLPTIWTDEKQSREEAREKRKIEERRVEEKE